jgi:hypothetical protein
MFLFLKLPPELVKIILAYADIKCRNGVYIGQISKTDLRRETLQNIPSKIYERNTPFRFPPTYTVYVSFKSVMSLLYAELDLDEYLDENDANYYSYVFTNSYYTIDINNRIINYHDDHIVL